MKWFAFVVNSRLFIKRSVFIAFDYPFLSAGNTAFLKKVINISNGFFIFFKSIEIGSIELVKGANDRINSSGFLENFIVSQIVKPEFYGKADLRQFVLNRL